MFRSKKDVHPFIRISCSNHNYCCIFLTLYLSIQQRTVWTFSIVNVSLNHSASYKQPNRFANRTYIYSHYLHVITSLSGLITQINIKCMHYAHRQTNSSTNQTTERPTDRSTITFYCEHLCKLTVCFGSLPAPEPKMGRSMCVLDDGNLIGIFKYRLSLLLVVGCTYCLISYGLRFLVCNEEIRMP